MKKFILICLLAISQICSAQMISSYYADQLDLDRVLNLFCMSNTTEEFEKALNAPNSRLSMLDLNNDGYIDYLRCLELAGIHDTIYVLIEACIGEDQYYEVAVICIKKTYNNVTVYISGNELLYGPNYIIRPVYNIYYYPIYNRHWVYGYYWHSPYRWGYWPPHYRPYHPYRPYRPYHPQSGRPVPSRHVTRIANPAMPPSEPSRPGTSSAGNRHTTRVATPVNTGRTQPQQSVNRESSIVRTTTPTSNNTRTSSGDSRNTYTSTRPSSGTTTNTRTSINTSGSRNNSVSTSRSTVQPAKSSSSAVRSSNTGSRSSSGGSNVSRSSNVRSSNQTTSRTTSTRTTSSGSNPSGSRSSQNAVRR